MWDIEKIQNFINDKVEENIHLDYKAGDALLKTDGKKREIGKDVSAFANSDGGVIIYGIKEYQDNKKFLPESIDAVDRINFSKETLEQIINSNVSPKIPGIIITPITIGEDSDNRVVYVVEIPKSNTAHQASDKRYYRRYNFQSEAMDDWEIKDIINRSSKSDVYIWFEPKIPIDTFEYFKGLDSANIDLDLWVYNKGNRISHYINVYLVGDIEDVKMFKSSSMSKFSETFEISFANEIERKVTLKNEEHIVNVQRFALLPKVAKYFGSITVLSSFFKQGKRIKIIISTDDDRKVLDSSIEDVIKNGL